MNHRAAARWPPLRLRFVNGQGRVAERGAERAAGRLRARNRYSQPVATETPRQLLGGVFPGADGLPGEPRSTIVNHTFFGADIRGFACVLCFPRPS